MGRNYVLVPELDIPVEDTLDVGCDGCIFTYCDGDCIDISCSNLIAIPPGKKGREHYLAAKAKIRLGIK